MKDKTHSRTVSESGFYLVNNSNNLLFRQNQNRTLSDIKFHYYMINLS